MAHKYTEIVNLEHSELTINHIDVQDTDKEVEYPKIDMVDLLKAQYEDEGKKTVLSHEVELSNIKIIDDLEKKYKSINRDKDHTIKLLRNSIEILTGQLEQEKKKAKEYRETFQQSSINITEQMLYNEMKKQLLSYKRVVALLPAEVGKRFHKDLLEVQKSIDAKETMRYIGLFATVAELPLTGSEGQIALVGTPVSNTLYRYDKGWQSYVLYETSIPYSQSAVYNSDGTADLSGGWAHTVSSGTLSFNTAANTANAWDGTDWITVSNLD